MFLSSELTQITSRHRPTSYYWAECRCLWHCEWLMLVSV